MSNDVLAERLCGWKGKAKGTMDRFYADLPEVSGLANLAGFPEGCDQYYIHRAHVDPEEHAPEVFAAFWPEIPAQLELVIRLREELPDGHPDRPPESKVHFLTALNWLRRVFLQDVPFLIEAHPEHPTWKHPLFQSDEFEAWSNYVKEQVKESHSKGQDRGVKVSAGYLHFYSHTYQV